MSRPRDYAERAAGERFERDDGFADVIPMRWPKPPIEQPVTPERARQRIAEILRQLATIHPLRGDAQ